MTENNYGIRDIKNQHLKYSYKKYTDLIIGFEKHAKRMYDDWVIDINNRNIIMHKLDNLVRSMIKIYNECIMEIYNKTPNENESDNISNTNKKINNAIYNKIYNEINKIERIENKNSKLVDSFNTIREQLIELAKNNGFHTINDFIGLYVGENYESLFNNLDTETFELYKGVFVPLSISINKIKKKYRDTNKQDTITISKIPSKCDGLIENTCTVTITMNNIFTEIIFEGYVSADILNAYLRTSQIYSKHLFNVKNESKRIVKESYPHVDEYFIAKYAKLINSNVYFINNPDEMATKIDSDYMLFTDLTTKNFNTIVKEFVNSSLPTMFSYINVLLMGSNQDVNNAGLLFNLLKDRKIGSETLSDIIYHNLSFHLQIKLKKIINSIKNELGKIRSLTPEEIPIEKKLASMVNMPENVKNYIIEKNNEIKTGENNYKLQMAINGLMQFPWKPKDFNNNNYFQIKNSVTKSRNYLQNVAKKLNETVFGHENSKKVLIELVGKWIQNPESSGQVIGLVGPPGVGKTLLAKGISAALGIPLSIVGLGGMSDSADLIGHSFTYAGAQYGMIVRQMIKAGNWRSVMFFDEVDKVSKRNDTNEIYNTLIHITDPNMNQNFQDRFYSSAIDFDLSGVLIVFSYNSSEKLDPILLDRIKEIKISPYSLKEKILIAQNHVIKELCSNIGFDREKINIGDDIIEYIIEKYTMEAGVRELKRKLEQILLKVNIDRFYMRGPFYNLLKKYNPETQTDDNSHSLEENQINMYVDYKPSLLEKNSDPNIISKIFNLDIDDHIIITKELVHKYLDKPTLTTEEIHKTNMIGVINGLYATSVGMGGIVPIQIYKNFVGDKNDGSNLKLKITGNQKQVMRESVMCALTTAVNVLNNSIKSKILDKFPHGFHVHAPDGGTPKDGPSAGCAFTTAFVSTILGKKINRQVAMTGEIELTGKISKIGGLDAKLTGAKKAGIKCVYICEDNKEDYEIIKKKSPELFQDGLEIKIVNHIIEIITDPNVIIDIDINDFDKDLISEFKRLK
ncbi:lon protease-like protein [Acanthamoeba polyphaga mimivirus]|uniref:Lon protease-like protein n=1 Tax=Acanthamoeba polyphaga mimivirus Kroon TaxID=3069720 RepID=A0A0G2Y2I1_9VIRU|nr:lon protease-like protein [Acanthamoeba polyphaga mimivirus]AKI79983.1 lon protease-like protein [Acanthamoeba polyphaga mimivirus Kroon]